jgi:ribonuclease-3
MTLKELDVIQEKIGYKFNEQYLLVQAFTRKSFATENQNWEDNEKLEFVGDKVLDFIVVKKLTNMYGFKAETFAQSLDSIQKGEKASASNCVDEVNFEFVHSEGEMTEIKKQVVQTSFLARAIENLELEQYLLMGKGDIKNNVQNETHVKEDLFEAIMGAIAIDSTWNMIAIEKAIDKMLNINYYIQNGVDDGIDYVSYIQNWHQKEYGKEPDYVFYANGSEEIFQCDLELKGLNVFEGFGYSKKEAIRLAAKRAYEFLQKLQQTTNKFLDVVGSFDFETSISKLQMLQDKKMISGLDYIFREGDQTESNNGNPMWYCQCKVDGIDEYIEYGDFKKANAKKASAFTMLEILTTGRDKIGEKIAEEFYKENNILNTLTDGGNNDEQ